MDFAFSTILLFLIIVPGLIARYFYFTHPFSNSARSSDIIAELLWSIIPGFLIQLVASQTIPQIEGKEISFDDIGFLVVGKEDNGRLTEIMNNIKANIYPILKYNGLIFVISAILGVLAKWFIRWTKLDRRLEIFQFSNKWYYIMSGEVLDQDEGPGKSDDINYTGIDVLCRVGGEQILYKGRLLKYYLAKNGDLDSILLRNPSRRKFDANPGDEPLREVDIPSNMLVIPYKDIVNINIRYIKFELETAYLNKLIKDIEEIDRKFEEVDRRNRELERMSRL